MSLSTTTTNLRPISRGPPLFPLLLLFIILSSSSLTSFRKILLSDIKQVRKNATGRAHCFGVATSDRLYWFAVENEVMFQKWTISIRVQAGLGL